MASVDVPTPRLVDLVIVAWCQCVGALLVPSFKSHFHFLPILSSSRNSHALYYKRFANHGRPTYLPHLGIPVSMKSSSSSVSSPDTAEYM
ncbi:hypothetical protein V8E55_001274 [Tylopilus felleus]